MVDNLVVFSIKRQTKLSCSSPQKRSEGAMGRRRTIAPDYDVRRRRRTYTGQTIMKMGRWAWFWMKIESAAGVAFPSDPKTADCHPNAGAEPPWSPILRCMFSYLYAEKKKIAVFVCLWIDLFLAAKWVWMIMVYETGTRERFSPNWLRVQLQRENFTKFKYSLAFCFLSL